MSTTTVTLNGNVTSDPEIKFLENGSARLSFGVAVNYYWNDRDGERQEKTSFFNVVAWKELAEYTAEVIEKGMRVIVIGRLEQRQYTTKEGDNRSIIEVTAEEIGASVRGIQSAERRQRAEGSKGGDRKPSGRPDRAAATGRGAVRKAQPTLEEADEPF